LSTLALAWEIQPAPSRVTVCCVCVGVRQSVTYTVHLAMRFTVMTRCLCTRWTACVSRRTVTRCACWQQCLLVTVITQPLTYHPPSTFWRRTTDMVAILLPSSPLWVLLSYRRTVSGFCVVWILYANLYSYKLCTQYTRLTTAATMLNPVSWYRADDDACLLCTGAILAHSLHITPKGPCVVLWWLWWVIFAVNTPLASHVNE